MKIICAYDSDKGNYRKVNQDTVYVDVIRQKNHVLAVGAVFDGIGGLEHGEIASGTLKMDIKRWFSEICSWINLDTIEKEIIFSHFRDLAEYLNENIWQIRQNQKMNTGSTMAAILIFDDQYHIIHVGDSRIYKFHHQLQCLTVDDIIVKETEHGVKNYLANYMGKQPELDFSEYHGVVETGDLFLVCSDGFYHHLVETDLQGISAENACVTKLIEKMKRRGERDNITVGLIQVSDDRKFFIKC